MTSIRKLVGVLCLATCFSLPSNAQETYTSENLVNGTWHGTVTNTSVSGGEGSHTQGSGPVPIYNPNTNTITWSYSQYSALNIIGVNAALSAAGTGIRISGYNYSWEYYNQDFNRGSLTAITQQYGSSGTVLEQYSYSLARTTNGWTLYSGTQRYNNEYDLASLGNFALYFVGRDDRFWAGYYGPMVRNPSISFNYTVGAAQPEPDPCASPYSLSCPQNFVSYSEPEPVIETAPMATNEPVQQVVEASPQSSQQASVQQSSQSTPIESASAQESSGSRVSTSTVLSILSREQARVGAVERSTVEATVEQSALQALQATQDAESIAAGAQAESISISISAQESSQSGGTASNFTSNDSASSSTLTSSSSGTRGADTPLITNVQNEEIKTDLSSTIELTASNSHNQESNFASEETKNDAVSVSGFSATDILKQETNVSREETQREQKTETVKQNVQNNELAGNVTLASLGATPQGFQAYSITMPDSSFYAPKEIYRNQRTVDNPAGRRLFGGSDRMHQEMVDQQYKRN
jgi:hypothetical protein